MTIKTPGRSNAMGKGNPFGNIPGIGNMMKQVQKMQEDMSNLEQELTAARIEAGSGGGMVTAVASGAGEILDIKISPEVVDPEDVEMLQDLVVTAVREVLEKAAQMKEAKLKEITGGLGIPGLM
jgi:DNA-binding YbaB/EbfC family protein